MVQRQIKILIVDDEQFNRMALKIILNSMGLENTEEKCIFAINGLKALDAVKKDVEANLNSFCSI